MGSQPVLSVLYVATGSQPLSQQFLCWHSQVLGFLRCLNLPPQTVDEAASHLVFLCIWPQRDEEHAG